VHDLVGQQDSLREGFKELRENEYFFKILGGILTIGNIMNAGNKNRGQADGFLIDSFSRSFSVRDADNTSVM